MVLQIELRAKTNVPVEVAGITPDAVRELSPAKIEQLPILYGNQQVPLAEVFAVRGTAADETHEWLGDLAGVHYLGCKMQSGRIELEGNAGRHVGCEMRGGEIMVRGNVGDWLGAECHGGTIRVVGNAGDLVGAAYRGGARGMTRGTILIEGNAGDEVGHSLRRGLIAVSGSIGDLAGHRMLAGTILALGECGIRHGAGLKRGTLALLGKSRPPLLPTFRPACRYEPGVMQVLYRSLQRLKFPIPEELLTTSLDVFNGDLLAGGRGEVLCRAAD